VKVRQEGRNALLESRQAGARERSLLDELDGGGPQIEAALDSVAVDVLGFDDHAVPYGLDERHRRRRHHRAAQQHPAATVRQRQAGDHRGEREVAAAREAEDGDDDAEH